jgi:hypothetical protein
VFPPLTLTGHHQGLPPGAHGVAVCAPWIRSDGNSPADVDTWAMLAFKSDHSTGAGHLRPPRLPPIRGIYRPAAPHLQSGNRAFVLGVHTDRILFHTAYTFSPGAAGALPLGFWVFGCIGLIVRLAAFAESHGGGPQGPPPELAQDVRCSDRIVLDD